MLTLPSPLPPLLSPLTAPFPVWQVEEIEMEWNTPDGCFSVDIFLVYRGLRVAIEVDGPFHFSVNDPERPLGSMLLRHRRVARGDGWA